MILKFKKPLPVQFCENIQICRGRIFPEVVCTFVFSWDSINVQSFFCLNYLKNKNEKIISKHILWNILPWSVISNSQHGECCRARGINPSVCEYAYRDYSLLLHSEVESNPNILKKVMVHISKTATKDEIFQINYLLNY